MHLKKIRRHKFFAELLGKGKCPWCLTKHSVSVLHADVAFPFDGSEMKGSHLFLIKFSYVNPVKKRKSGIVTYRMIHRQDSH